MKTPPADLDAKELARVLRAEYGFDSGELTFVPKGEDAYIYVTEAGYGPQFFVRAQDRKRAKPLEEALRSAAQLRETCGLHEILAAIPACGSAFTCRCGEYLIAVFPFVQGTTAFESGFSKPRIEQAARFIGRLHNCTPGVSLIRERFENPFTQPILRALSQAESRPKTEIAVLLLQQREDLIRTLNRMERFNEELSQLDIHRVPTHGDPNLDNLLWDAEERLFVTDWGELAAGPAERDLFAFTGAHFRDFLADYVSERSTIKLHIELFSFYFYRWSLQEIADYSARLLLARTPPEEATHAWRELRKYLPLRHDKIAREVERIARDLDDLMLV